MPFQQEVGRHLKTYGAASAVCLIVWIALMVYTKDLAGLNQTLFVLGRMTIVIPALFVVYGAFGVYDYISGGRLLEKILETSTGAALFAVGLMLCAVLLFMVV